MLDLSASAIAALAFLDHLIKTEAGKSVISGIWTALGEKTLNFGMDKIAAVVRAGRASITALRNVIIDKLRGNPKAEVALKAAEEGDEKAISTVAAHLQLAMNNDESFSAQVQQMAQQIINIGKIDGQNVQNVFGGQAIMVNDPKDKVINAGDHNTFNFYPEKPD